MPFYVRSDAVVSRKIAGETLIVPISKGVGDLASIFSLNPVASAIWDGIAAPSSATQIVQRIAEAFDGEPQQIESDVESFLAEMESAGLVKAVGVAAHV
ncbi:MAG TPA: PqqD family protein [Terriglobales bacterium]|nr:PqqD family protein [Terriglobales bacterium]